MIYYFDTAKKSAVMDFAKTLRNLIREKKCNTSGISEVVLICIGSDRATGDCLGPMVGHRMSKHQKQFSVYGTLEKPVHAKNLSSALDFIHAYHKGALIIAIDASLGRADHIGYITLGEGSLSPGVGVDKDLPDVGDLFITGIVNLAAFKGTGHLLLQTTRLNTVMQLTDFICMGLNLCFTVKSSPLTPAVK
ncbi:MAG: spore protease YyaC [Lachnoclostridium sp.]|jgi:putative sporulation protein YyaC|nr:spore protease YyaC [Lachnoclostridium sp.]